MTRRPKKAKARAKARKSLPPKGLSGTDSRHDPLDDFVEAGARALGLKIAKTWMPAVRNHLQVTLQHGALVMEFALPDDAEPAPVFEA